MKTCGLLLRHAWRDGISKDTVSSLGWRFKKMAQLAETILGKYFQSAKELIDTEQVDERSVVVSFPIYFYANHRVELLVKELPNEQFQISDMAGIIGELKLAGMTVNSKTRTRLTELARNAKLTLSGDELTRVCESSQLGDVLHLFADSAKTIGDVYLVHKTKNETEDELRAKVKQVLLSQNYAFKE